MLYKEKPLITKKSYFSGNHIESRYTYSEDLVLEDSTGVSAHCKGVYSQLATPSKGQQELLI